MVISLFAYVATFSGQLYFRRSYFFTYLQSSYFDTTEQLLFQSSCFFRASTFFWQLSFQNSYFFRAKLLPSSHHLRIGSSLGYLLFGTVTFLAKELFRIKICTEELLFWSRYLCTASTISEELHFGKKRIFQKSNITVFFWRVVFSESLLFQKTLSSIAATFSEELLFYNILFQKSYHFTATLPFHSNTYYL